MFDGFKKILQFGVQYKRYAFLNIFFNALYALFSALSFVSLIPMLNVLFKTTKKQLTPAKYEGILTLQSYVKDNINYYVSERLAENTEGTLVFVISLILCLFFLKNTCNYLALYFITFLRNGILKDLRNSLFKKITTLPIHYFNEKRKGDLMAKITSDVSEIQSSYLSILELVVREPLTIIFSVCAMLFFSLKLTLFVLIFIPLCGVIISNLGKKLRKKSSQIQQQQGDFLSIIDETINGQKIIKTFGASEYFKNKFFKATQIFYNFSNQLLHRASLAGPVSEFLGISTIGILLWFGGRMVLLDETIAGTTFIVYMGLAYNILTPAKGISKANYSIQKGNAAADRILEILNIEDHFENTKDCVTLNNFKKGIVFDKVFFSYENKNVINNFSLKIKKGEMVALIGPSGSGKTTITHLLNRFYDIDRGILEIDGIPINKIDKKSLYKQIGLVTQESILFNDTVFNNLLIGNPKASKEDIINACKAAYAHKFIKELPEGYETNIGDLGNKLSGGQKQRITIARALLKDPQLLILDEATSSLDTESEQQVQYALDKLMLNRTSLVIAHRLSTIKKADRILLIDDGQILARGTHKQLLTISKHYKKWVQIQRMD